MALQNQTALRNTLSSLSCLLIAIFFWLAVSSPTFAEPRSPDMATLENLIEQYFTHARNPSKPILLTQSKVRDLLESLKGVHIYIPGRNQIVRSFPHDKEFFSRFVLAELAQDPAMAFPEDPTFLFQRIDLMCTSHEGIRHLAKIAGNGESFSQSWVSKENLFPSLESARLQQLLEELGVENAAEPTSRRRNYTIEHLLEVLEEAYAPSLENATVTTSLDSLGR